MISHSRSYRAPTHALQHRFFFFFNDTATTEIYTLSLHDALPISSTPSACRTRETTRTASSECPPSARSEEHTSELQSLAYLVCRLLLEKKKSKQKTPTVNTNTIPTASSARSSASLPYF